MNDGRTSELDSMEVEDEWCTLCFKVDARRRVAMMWMRRRGNRTGWVGHCEWHMTRGARYDEAKARSMFDSETWREAVVQAIMDR